MIEKLKKIISEKKIFSKHNYYEIKVDKRDIISIVSSLKDDENFFFDQLIDITAVDYPSRKERFEIVYILLSLRKNKRIIIKTLLNEGDQVDSISSIFECANWYERECYDLFGIFFKNHPDLRRIMTDYGFEGHPLRKDFPLTGHTEVRYDDLEKKVIYEPVKLIQEFRNFDYESPWEGMPNTFQDNNKSDDEDLDERN